jgi:hypothetical protein
VKRQQLEGGGNLLFICNAWIRVKTLERGGQLMNTEEKLSVIKTFVHAYNAFDIETMMSLLHPEFEFRHISSGRTSVIASSLNEYRDFIEYGAELFSSRKLTVMDIQEVNDRITAGIVYAGVLAVDLPDGLKAGDTLKHQGCHEYIFRDGMIYRVTDIDQ